MVTFIVCRWSEPALNMRSSEVSDGVVLFRNLEGVFKLGEALETEPTSSNKM